MSPGVVPPWNQTQIFLENIGINHNVQPFLSKDLDPIGKSSYIQQFVQSEINIVNKEDNFPHCFVFFSVPRLAFSQKLLGL